MSDIRTGRNERDQKLRKGALGKGFNSLLGLSAEEMEDAEGTVGRASSQAVVELPIDDIEPNPHQPRKLFDDEALKTLTQSIKEDGILQPLLVSRGEKPSKYVLIAGERRWRAARLAGLEKVPVLIKEKAPEDMLRIALIENIQRSDLNIIEEAEAYSSLIRDFGLTQDACAKKVGKDRTTVTNALRLLALPREVQDDLVEGRLSMGHGRTLLSLDDKKMILRARDMVVKKAMNVRQTEQLCKAFQKKGTAAADEQAATERADPDMEYMAESLRSHLRTKVKLSGNPSRGKIEISYFSAAELERIIEAIGVRF